MYKTRNRNHEGRKRRSLFCFQETTSWQLHLVFQFGGGIGGECSQIRLLCSSQYTHTCQKTLLDNNEVLSLVLTQKNKITS